MHLQTLELRQDKLLHDMRSLVDTATKEARALSAEEQKSYGDFDRALASVGTQIDHLKRGEDFTQRLDEITGGSRLIVQHAVKYVGAQVVESKAYGDLRELAKRSRRIESDLIEVKAAPILDGALVPTDPLNRIVPGPTQRVIVAGLFAQGRTNANSVTYNRETGFTNAASAVAEATAKPESELLLASIVEPVRKYAHFVTASKEALEDIPMIRSYIDGRLRYGLALNIDYALINGSTTPPNLVGILNRPGLSPAITQGASESVVDAILRQAAALQAASGVPPDGVVINPADWTKVLMAKDQSGQYYGNGPFQAPTPNGPMLWGDLTVAATPSIAAGTILVGAFGNSIAAQLLWRETMAFSFSNSHNDYFVRNLVALLIEARLALVVSLPEAFGVVTLLP